MAKTETDIADLSSGRIKTNENNIDQHHHWIINDLSGGRIKTNENTINSHGIHLQIIDISNQKHEERLDDIDDKITDVETNNQINKNEVIRLERKIDRLDVT